MIEFALINKLALVYIAFSLVRIYLTIKEQKIFISEGKYSPLIISGTNALLFIYNTIYIGSEIIKSLNDFSLFYVIPFVFIWCVSIFERDEYRAEIERIMINMSIIIVMLLFYQ